MSALKLFRNKVSGQEPATLLFQHLRDKPIAAKVSPTHALLIRLAIALVSMPLWMFSALTWWLEAIRTRLATRLDNQKNGGATV